MWPHTTRHEDFEIFVFFCIFFSESLHNMTKRELLNDEGFEDTFVFDDENLKILGLSHDDRAVYLSKDVQNKCAEFGDKKPPILMSPCDVSSIEGLTVLGPRYLDTAIIGVTDDNRVVYDYDKLRTAFMKAEGWDEEESDDWINYNTIRSLPYIPNSPVIMFDISYMI